MKWKHCSSDDDDVEPRINIISISKDYNSILDPMSDHQGEKEAPAVAEVTASVQELMLKHDSEYVRFISSALWYIEYLK